MIRRFEKKDLHDVMSIWINENIKAHPFIPPKYWQSHYDGVKEILPGAEVYVYILKERIVGFIGLYQDSIEGIFVEANYQGLGVGTSLLNKAKENRSRLVLKVYKKNTNAVRFYKKNGFILEKEGEDKDTNEIEYTMIWKKNQQMKRIGSPQL